jgi:hypothetical protein
MSLTVCILIKEDGQFKLTICVEELDRIHAVRKAFVVYGRHDLVEFASAAEYSNVNRLTSVIKLP